MSLLVLGEELSLEHKYNIPTRWVTPRRRVEKKTTSQSSAKAPFYAVGAVGLSIGPLPVNNGNNPKGEITKQSKQHVIPMNKDK